MNTYDFDHMSKTYGHTRTSDFNGRKASKGRRVLEVVDAAYVPADWPGTKNIMAQAIVQGKHGAQYNAYILKSGFISVI